MKAVIAYWQHLSRREQRLLTVAMVALVLASLYWGVISPLQARAELAKQQLANEKSLLTWVNSKGAEIEALRSVSGSGGQVSALPLNQSVTSSVKRFNLEILRLQPQREELQVWLKPMPFNSLLRWLDFLSKTHGVEVKFIDLGKTDTQGMVEVKRLQLGRG
ncbi:type II secretion system protein M [Enterovibrio nigricans]|uniref:Type II secretion system protein M n=1 Tax=Enterovibrio nigricans DSM 22720 TaxID=1121868 RepID=A0A1T4UA78_9GAMM|nr:type II secretion system protein M [Enterovibrio nigricans]PKF51404.1 type II secretion system protein M [Enterovibrio nigricans]SKA49567.1 general secretion pathway protein M [Enterovibrio nigricans DSM 22720]